jgi:peroxiredoxin/mannose-6-phosphate isomerase-like protein (cupin superfamily)
MKESIRRYQSGDESFTEEGCYINELSNSPDDTDVSIARARLEPGLVTRWHRLSETVERYVILQGCGRVEIGKLPPTEVREGDVVLIPKMCRQRITNTGADDLVFLAICTPRFSDAVYEDINNNLDEVYPKESKMLQKNQLAPEFTAPDPHNNTINLSDYRGDKNVVLYFYPKDDTTGCTIEARQFTALASEFSDFDTIIFGVSKDSCESHQAFIEKYDLNVILLADTSGELCERYGVWQQKEKNGQKKMGIVRSTFIINKQGILEDVNYGVTADGHAQEMLEKIKQLQEIEKD